MKSNKFISLLAIGVLPFLLNGYINTYICDTIILFWLYEFFTWIFMPYLIFMILINRYNLRLHEIGISSKILGKESIFLIILFTFITSPIDYFLYDELYNFFSENFSTEALFNYQIRMPQDEALKILAVIYFSVSSGIVEELYRGLVYKISTFYSRPYLIFLIASPIVFALPHWETGLANLLAVYFLGLIFSSIFLVIKNLWPLIIGHIFVDLIWFS